VDFNVTGQQLIIYFVFIKYLKKSGNTIRQCISYLKTSRKHMIHLGGGSFVIFCLSFVSP
jgi:hypothetical protein